MSAVTTIGLVLYGMAVMVAVVGVVAAVNVLLLVRGAHEKRRADRA